MQCLVLDLESRVLYAQGLRVLDEFKAFVTAEQDRCRKGSMK